MPVAQAAVEPPQLDLRAGRAALRRASGMTARASAAASAEMTWLPCPPAPPESTGRGPARRGSAHRSSSRSRRDAQERAPALALGDGVAQDRPVDRSEQVACGRPGAGSPGRTNSSKVTEDETGLPGSPNSRTGRRRRPGRSRDPERERLARLDRDPPELDPADRLERGLDDVVRPDRHAARHDERVGALDEPAPRAGRGRRRASSVAIPRSIGSPPAASTSARSPGRWRPGCRPGRAPRRRARTSSPVASTAIRGRRMDVDVGDARAGRRARRAAAVSAVPASTRRRARRGGRCRARTDRPRTGDDRRGPGRPRAAGRSRRDRADPAGPRRRAASSPRPGRRHRRRPGAGAPGRDPDAPSRARPSTSGAAPAATSPMTRELDRVVLGRARPCPRPRIA